MRLSKLVKEFGAKVEKELAGYYIYKGKNFTVKFNSEECETSWWEVNLYDECPNVVYNEFYDYNKYETKKEIVGILLNIDKSI